MRPFKTPDDFLLSQYALLDPVAGKIKASHRWVSGPPGEPPAYAGTDFIIARDGRIAAAYLTLRRSQQPA
jgi:hypothetical protein